ncbi:hypothetical protein GIB67_028112 [Kingdonia uniflora]|uniref:Uncharacterized protein n=1 Tax=Kingdonia uniflora TaxID=39325 RepID=A0A7J7NQT5_9MAGN|nr:hypothetical protein GIB67_028112 [Kingdonia uniflora]
MVHEKKNGIPDIPDDDHTLKIYNSIIEKGLPVKYILELVLFHCANSHIKLDPSSKVAEVLNVIEDIKMRVQYDANMNYKIMCWELTVFFSVSEKLNSVGDQYSVKAVENSIGTLTKLEADLLSLSREVVPAYARILLRTSLEKKHLVWPLLRIEITQVVNRHSWYDATKLITEVLNLYKVPLCVEGWDEALHEIGRLSEDALVSLKSFQVMASKHVNS